MEDNNEKLFYPSVEYNKKRRMKYIVLSVVGIVLSVGFTAWIASTGNLMGLFMLFFVVLAVALLPKALKENPVKHVPIVSVGKKEVTVSGKKIARSNVTAVGAVVYLGSVGNSIENRKFLEKTASERPPENMIGSFEVRYTTEDGKQQSEYAVIENVVEAFSEFVKEGKVSYKLGYSLGKEYRVSTYNFKEFLAEEAAKDEHSAKNKVKQLI
ncbi:MAG: hypothetical protein MRZ91_02095 [Christensenellaceae bacterium]|nr:hypothetical protein [Christensenellaceae bacterium]MDD6926621.1 hypothetical protein [bacterium]MDY2851413.1 hypothetical protein [Christensenellaceae bacterium]